MSYKSVREILNSVFDSSDDTLRTINKTDGEVLNMVLDESGDPALKVSMPDIDASTLNGTYETEFMQKSEYELLAGTLSAPLFHAPLKNGLGLVHGAGSLTFSRSSSATYVDRYGVLQSASIDEPRFEKEGILIEGESTNIWLQSEDFTQAEVTKSNVGILGTYDTAPDGVSNALRVAETATTSFHSLAQTLSINAGEIYTFSAKVKKNGDRYVGLVFRSDSYANGAMVVVDTNDGSYVSSEYGTGSVTGVKIREFKNYYRIELSGKTDVSATSVVAQVFLSTSSNTFVSYSGDGTSYVTVWGVQFEPLPFASSYIPTTTTAVTRSADYCYIPWVDNANKLDENFTILCDFHIKSPEPVGAARMVIGLGNYPNAFQTYVASNNKRLDTLYATTATFLDSSSEDWSDKAVRLGHTKSGDLISTYYDGVPLDTETVTEITGNYSTEYIGIGSLNIGAALYGHISNFRIYDKALTEAQMRVA